jgi:hypothetical protein
MWVTARLQNILGRIAVPLRGGRGAEVGAPHACEVAAESVGPVQRLDAERMAKPQGSVERRARVYGAGRVSAGPSEKQRG